MCYRYISSDLRKKVVYMFYIFFTNINHFVIVLTIQLYEKSLSLFDNFNLLESNQLTAVFWDA